MRTARIALLLMCGLAAGCSTMQWNKPSTWIGKAEKDHTPRIPTKVVAIWKETVLHQPGKEPVRGFGGRLVFYKRIEDEPVCVAGTLVVYGFNETGRDPSNAKPDRKFIFPAEQFEKHYSDSDIGHSYNVWLPWDDAGGPPTKVSLIVRFQPKKGALIVSEPAAQLLPGTGETQVAVAAVNQQSVAAIPPEGVGPIPTRRSLGAVGDRALHLQSPATSTTGNGGVELAGHTTEGVDKPGLTTATIRLPTNFGRLGPASLANRPQEELAAAQNLPAIAAPVASPAATPAAGSGRQTDLQRPAHSQLGIPRALGRPLVRPNDGHAPWRPNPGVWRPGS